MKSKLGLVIAAFLAAALFATPNINAATASRSDCTSVYKTYPFGISLNKQSIGTSRAEINRAKYIQLKYLDKDLDGVVCEIEKLQTKVTTPVTTPVTTTTTSMVSSVCASGGACSLGDIGPGGGTVFYDAGSTQTWGRYLEAAPNDLPNYFWNDAVNASQAYRGGGLSGWRLPTKTELNSLYVNRGIVGNLHTIDRGYWSSSEYDASNAWFQAFNDGHQGAWGKLGSKFFVRPVRAF